MASANDIIEAPTRIEPARLEETPEAIADAIAALSSASAALGARLHPATAANLFDLDNLDARLARHVERSDRLKPEAARLLREALVRGRIDRGEASRITGLPERTARRVLGDVVDAGLLASATPKGPVSLRFPVDTLEGLFPRLYPDT